MPVALEANDVSAYAIASCEFQSQWGHSHSHSSDSRDVTQPYQPLEELRLRDFDSLCKERRRKVHKSATLLNSKYILNECISVCGKISTIVLGYKYRHFFL